MKRRMLAVLLTLIMVIGMMPATAFAAPAFADIDGHWAEEAKFLKNDLLTVQVVNLIYRGYQRIGMEPPSVQELLQWCAEDPSPWGLYHKGCTLCLNQVEKTGTSARAGIYKPSNISELCAFIAAIRPG